MYWLMNCLINRAIDKLIDRLTIDWTNLYLDGRPVWTLPRSSGWRACATSAWTSSKRRGHLQMRHYCRRYIQLIHKNRKNMVNMLMISTWLCLSTNTIIGAANSSNIIFVINMYIMYIWTYIIIFRICTCNMYIYLRLIWYIVFLVLFCS